MIRFCNMTSSQQYNTIKKKSTTDNQGENIMVAVTKGQDLDFPMKLMV